MELYYPLILDGANGTELQNRGFDGSACTESWVLEHPEVMKELQLEYIRAGSRIIYAPTFGANRVKLEENGIFNRTAQYNRELAGISLEAAAAAADEAEKEGRPDPQVLVAGDIATSGKFLSPLGDVSFQELYEIYLEQAEAMEEAGVDMYVIETIMTVPDARAALLAVRSVSDKPVLVSFTCDEKGRTLTGTDVTAACVIMQGMGADAFGLNCSVGPGELLKQIKRLRRVSELPLSAKPNAGLPVTIDGRTVYDCTPEEFAKYIPDFAAEGVGLFGGCCGTGPGHIAALRDALSGAGFAEPCPEKTDGVLCATEKDVFVIKPGTKINSVLSCGAELEAGISRANKSDDSIIAIEIRGEADLDEFEAAQYAIKKPLCIVCDDAELLGQALMLYQGRALYAGSLTREELAPFIKKYGLLV